MRFSASFIAACGLLHAQSALARPSAEPRHRQRPQRQGGAAYLITNEDENMVVSFPRDKDGMLGQGSMISTGGAGSASIDGSTNEPAAVDPLVAQSALTVAGKHLFAVNAGSNTLTMFNIDPADPAKLTMVGAPVDLPGEFPNTVAASRKNRVVCVGLSGATAGVSCAPFSGRGGIGAMDALRPFDLGQTTPPVGPTNTVSQVFFSQDEQMLYTTVKGDPAVNNTGFLASFAVESSCGQISSQAVMSSPDQTAVLFGSASIPGSTDLFVTDASFGAAVLSVNADSQATTKGRGVVEGQAATCWATISPATNTAFVTDVAVNRLVEMSLDDASILNEIDLSENGQSGMIDLAAAGKMVYVLAPGNNETEPAIVVLDAETKEVAQTVELGSLGITGRVQGMAVFGA
ncbi:lactonase, 7-bladed beta-propeller domain-containing protein [Sarocladium implicatum]|nr:lactonase, 7-bladed beta-propeller domain-containing protein [Sarocladium implicatum]